MADVRVRLQTSRIQLEFCGDQGLFERSIEPLLLGLAGGPAPPAATAPRRVQPEEAVALRGEEPRGYRPPSDRFGTFQRQLDVSENGVTNRVAAFAFFLWNYEKKEVFKEEEVEGCFHAEGLTPPEDSGEIYSDLQSKRILTPGAAERTWRLTGKGRDFVRHHLLSA
jgi:hypothetical protein